MSKELSEAEIFDLMAERRDLIAQNMRLTKEFTEGAIDAVAYLNAARPGIRRMHELERKLDKIPGAL